MFFCEKSLDYLCSKEVQIQRLYSQEIGDCKSLQSVFNTIYLATAENSTASYRINMRSHHKLLAHYNLQEVRRIHLYILSKKLAYLQLRSLDNR